MKRETVAKAMDPRGCDRRVGLKDTWRNDFRLCDNRVRFGLADEQIEFSQPKPFYLKTVYLSFG